MVDEVLEKAYKALEEWSKTVTVEQFIEDHKRIGLVRTPEEDDIIEKCHHVWVQFYGQEVCKYCKVFKWGKYKDDL